MALVLLKFPAAPAAFRKGVLQTLKDEQEHTRLYLERMKAPAASNSANCRSAAISGAASRDGASD
jgi:hypothetical protein